METFAHTSSNMLEANAVHRQIAYRGARSRRGLPSASAAVAAGLLAGGVMLLLTEFLAIAIYDESPWKIFRMMAAMVRGAAALEPADEYDASLVAIGLALHFSFAVLYSLALAWIVTELPRGCAALTGVLFGLALYYANFYGFTTLFPWFISFRTVDILAVHAVFGLMVATGYWHFLRPAER